MTKPRNSKADYKRMVEDVEELAELSEIRLADTPKNRRDCYVYANNAWGTYELLLVSFQLRWTHGLGGEELVLSRADALANNAARLWDQFSNDVYSSEDSQKPYSPDGIRWSQMPVSIGAVRFQFGTAMLVGILGSGRLNDACARVIVPSSEWTILPDRFASAYIDSGLCMLMMTGKSPKGWIELIHFRYGNLSGGDIAIQSYKVYESIIKKRKSVSQAALQILVDECGTLFPQRSRAAEGVFFDWEGKGVSNKQSKDFRLAAILKWCYSDRPDLYEAIVSEHKYVH